jgi:hypothetical protein
LELAVREERIFLTHDVETIPAFVYQMLTTGAAAPKVVVVPDRMPLGPAIDDLEVVLKLSESDRDWSTPILYLPL